MLIPSKNAFKRNLIAQTAILGFFLLPIALAADARSLPFNKLDSRLQSLLQGSGTPGAFPQGISLNTSYPIQNAIHPIYKGKNVRIEVSLNSANPQTIAQLKSLGMQISGTFGNRVSGAISPSRLKSLAELKTVTAVHPFIPPLFNAVEGEGVKGLRADRVQTGNPAFDGKGVKIGLLSDSFGKVSTATPVVQDIDGDGVDEIMGTDSQLAGELPPVIELLADASSSEGVTDEGRGMAEIVHEMAPGADLAFYTAWEGSASFADGIIQLASAGCQVIVDDVGYLAQPFYQDGEIAQAVIKAASEYNVVYLSAAGNSGARAIEGQYLDVDESYNDSPYAKVPTGSDFHAWNYGDLYDPSAYLPVEIPAKRTLYMVLQWENPFGNENGAGASCDYDFYAFAKPEFGLDSIIAYSDNYQGDEYYPYGDPVEIIGVTNIGEETGVVYLAVNLHHGTPANFKLLFMRGVNFPVSPNMRTGDANMIFGQTAAKECMAVAAVNSFEWLSGGQAQGNPRRIDPAFYSSLGGYIPILYSPASEPVSEPEIRFKPDIASLDGVNTSFFNRDIGSDADAYPNFFGTSAAAPHAAAIAALMRQANPALDAAEIRDQMRGAAVDIYTRGVDGYTGWGLLLADYAVKSVLDSFVPGNPGEEPQATPTPEEPEATPTPEITPTATSTPTPTPSPAEVSLATNTVIVMDDLFSAGDLSNGVDYDLESERNLTARWNIDSADVKDFHVYVKIDRGAPQYLGRTGDAQKTYFDWKANQKFLNPPFADGPAFAHVYEFMVYAITQSGTPPYIGPYTNAGIVELKELVPEF